MSKIEIPECRDTYVRLAIALSRRRGVDITQVTLTECLAELEKQRDFRRCYVDKERELIQQTLHRLTFPNASLDGKIVSLETDLDQLRAKLIDLNP